MLACRRFSRAALTAAVFAALCHVSTCAAAGVETVTLTATVRPAPGGGTVTLQDTSTSPFTVLDTEPVQDGIATFTVSNLAVGTHALTATFHGHTSGTGRQTRFDSASTSAPQSQTVLARGTSLTTLTSSLDPAGSGQSVTFIASVIVNIDGTDPTPTGRVQFDIDGQNVGGPVPLGILGRAHDTTSGLTVGTHTVLAIYLPTGSATGSMSVPLSQTVTVGNARRMPGGNVQFTVDGVRSGRPVALGSDGTATSTIETTSAGSHTVTATFLPTDAASASAPRRAAHRRSARRQAAAR